MLFFIRAKVQQKELTNEELWTLWEKEIAMGTKAMENGVIVDAYKIVARKEVILIYKASSHDELDRVFSAHLPLADYLKIKEITPIRSYLDFGEDVKNRWK